MIIISFFLFKQDIIANRYKGMLNSTIYLVEKELYQGNKISRL